MSSERTLSVPFELRLDTAELRRAGRLEGVVADLYAQMRVPVTGYVYQLVGSAQEAEDIVQATFLRLWDALQQGQEIRSIRSWVFRVVHNLAVDHARHAVVARLHERRAFQERERIDETSPESAAILRQEIEIGLSGLSERERHALMLRAEGLRYQEIAEVLGTTASAVSVHLVRGLRKFAEKTRRTP